MRSHLAEHFRRIRLGQGISLGRLARQVYKNVSKGSRRISNFEQTGKVTDDLLSKLANALCVDPVKVEELKERDRQEREQWASEPVKPFLVVRVFSAAYCRRNLPDEITDLEQAEAWAAEIARQVHKRVCLVWSRREIMYLDANGRVERRSTDPMPPRMTIAGKPIQFDFNDQQ